MNASLWRQAQLCIKNGLFEVTTGLYQVRGFDISNMTIIEGDTGVLIVDPLVSAEVAAAAMALYRAHRGDRPVTGVIYTHCHPDHFGGVMGVLPDGAGHVPIIAPAGFMDHAVTEWVYAGTAMNRRATFQYGNFLDVNAEGLVGTGLGVGNSTGSLGLLAPTLDITHTGQQETIDGVRIVFQITPGTEAPAEMNFHFPDHRPCARPRTPRTTCTTSSPCAARSSVTLEHGRATSTRRSNCSAATPMSCSPPTTGRPGTPSGSSRS